MNLIDKIKSIIHDLYMTWSYQDSLLSSKKLAKSCSYITATGLLTTCGIMLLMNKSGAVQNYGAVIAVATVIYGYGGYTSAQIEKEKKSIASDKLAVGSTNSVIDATATVADSTLTNN